MSHEAEWDALYHMAMAELKRRTERAEALVKELEERCAGYQRTAGDYATTIGQQAVLAKELAEALREHREWHRNEYQSNQWIDARADAALARYDATKEPENGIVCWNCKGAGRVNVYDARDPDPSIVKCKICGGKGRIPYMGYVAEAPARKDGVTE